MKGNTVANVDESKAITDDRHHHRGNKFRQQPTQKSGNLGPSAHKWVVVTWGGALRDNNQ